MKQDPISTRPLYMQLRDVLIDRISTGHWKSGAVIPSELELARELGASAGTMRKALDMLEAQHVLARKQGRGRSSMTNPRQP